MSIGERIKNRRIEMGLSQEELALRTGYKSRSAIAKIEADVNDIPRSKVVDFATVLKTTPSYLLGLNDDELIFKYDNIMSTTTRKIPLLGDIACGKPVFCDEDLESYIEVGTNIHADFALRCKGDSMINARIHDGDIVFIRKQPNVNNGEIAAVVIEDEATLKRVMKRPNMLILMPENNKYDPLVYTPDMYDQIAILGKAVAFQGDVK